MFFLCPVCGEALLPDGNALRCSRHHSFDRARAGYVNLLPPRGKGIHGDNKEMVLARRRFLESGAYAFLSDAVATALARHLPPNAVLLDAGCGEGYYTENVAMRRPDLTVIGIDISKDALAYAGKRLPTAHLAVASVYSLPLRDVSVDGIMTLFSPYAGEEFFRVLRPGGIMVMAIPAKRHLFGLKSALYATPYENDVADFALEGFRLLSHRHEERTVTLASHEEIANLFGMTPYAYRTRPEDKERLLSINSLTTELSFEVLVYEKTEQKK